MKKLFILFFCITVIELGVSRAQVDRTKKPSPGPTPTLTLPKIQRAVLKNGLKVMLVEHHELPVVQLHLVLQTGAMADPAGKSGVANLTARLLTEGTKKRSSLQIADELDFLGTSVNTSSSYDGSFATLQTLRDHLDKALDLFSDILLNPSFPQKEFDRVKKELLTNLLQQKDQPVVVANKVFASMLYGNNHPYGQPTDGTEASVNQITVEDLKTFYSTYFSPSNATLIVVGDVTMNAMQPLLEKFLGAWETKPVPEVKITEVAFPSSQRIYLVDKPKAAQSQIRIGHIGVARATDDFFPLLVTNTILGGGFNSRINWNLREQKGYTYGAGSAFQFRKAAGPFNTFGGFRTNVTDSSVLEIIKEIKRLWNEVVPESDLIFAKDFLTRSVPRTMETPGQIANQLSNLVLYNLPEDYFNTYIQNIEKVSAKDVRRVAEKYLQPDKMLIVIVGDVATIRTGLENLGYGKASLCDAEGKVMN